MQTSRYAKEIRVFTEIEQNNGGVNRAAVHEPIQFDALDSLDLKDLSSLKDYELH